MVHPGVQLRLLAGFGLWLSAGSLAVWNCRRYLVAGGSAPLVAGNQGGQLVLGIVILGIVILGPCIRGEPLRILAIEAAECLTGADLAARESHGLKAPFITEFRLRIRFPDRRRAIACIVSFLFADVLLNHKDAVNRAFAISTAFSRTDYHQSGARLLPLMMTAIAFSGVRSQWGEESSDVSGQ